MEIKDMNMEQIEARKAEIKAELEKPEADIDALTKEVDALEARAKEIRDKAEKRSALAGRVAAGVIGKPAEEGKTQMTPEERSAEQFAETGKMETRALLATGQIAKPTKVNGINGLAAVADSIVDDVNAVSLTGNGAWIVAYKKTEAAAADVTDGSAIGGTGATYSTVQINPAEWGVLDLISNQVKKMTPLDYQAQVRNSALIALRTRAAQKIVAAIQASDLATKKTVKIDQDYLRTVALGFRAVAGKGNTVLYLAQDDLVALGKIRGTNEKRALYEISFDPGTTTSGTITEGGLAVKFRVLDDLKAGTQLYGQPGTVDMPMWDNYEITTNDGGEYFASNQLAVRGLQTAGADLVVLGGMQIITNAAA